VSACFEKEQSGSNEFNIQQSTKPNPLLTF